MQNPYDMERCAEIITAARAERDRRLARYETEEFFDGMYGPRETDENTRVRAEDLADLFVALDLRNG